MSLVLTLDAALDGCGAGIVREGRVLAALSRRGGRGSAALLPDMAAAVLRDAGVVAADAMLGRVAVTVGPGSFTGVRAAVSLAQGIGAGAGIPVVGVSVGDALRAESPAQGPVWVAVDSRRGRIFLDTGAGFVSVDLGDLPMPDEGVLVLGDAAMAVVEALRRFDRFAQPGLAAPSPPGIAAAAARCPVATMPLYIDGVAARLQTMRPLPTG